MFNTYVIMFIPLWFVLFANVLVRCEFDKTSRTRIFKSFGEQCGQRKLSPSEDLPGTTKPLRYDLKIIPKLKDDFTFKGNVKITIDVISNTKKITLHSSFLNIVDYKITKNNVRLDSWLKIFEKNETIVLRTTEELVAYETYELYFSFNGILNPKGLYGFYRSQYKVNSETKWTASTQFEPSGARKAFPCYDEPQYRAIFGITIGRLRHESSLSNMPLKTTETDVTNNGRLWDTYHDTPKMATYLVAFVVGQLAHSTDSNLSFRVHSRENVIDDANYMLEQGPKLLKQISSFVDVPYSLPKMDAVAVPSALGSMENWGLTLFREKEMLYNEQKSTTKGKEMVLTTAAHEFAHQWFGDYVTPVRWDFSWMKEGFAMYLQFFLTNEIEPSWRMDEMFLIESLHLSLSVDGIHQHRSLMSVYKPQKIQDLFNIIHYCKGASIIRMVEHIVSTDTFKKALKFYLEVGSIDEGTVYPRDIWFAFDEQLIKQNRSLPHDLTVAKIVEAWMDQIGYPLITVDRVKDGEKYNLEIAQAVYKSPRSVEKMEDKQWIVPITYTTNSSADFNITEPTLWLTDSNRKVFKKGIDSQEWIICNIIQTGYYRVMYDNQNWHLLINQLRHDHNRIDVLNRVQIIDDSFFFAYDGKLFYSIPFEISLYLDNEKDVLPWYKGLKVLKFLHHKFRTTNVSVPLQDFISQRLVHIYEHIGFEVKSNDSHLTKTFRSLMLELACQLQISDCVSRAIATYKNNTDDFSKIHPGVKEAVFCTVLQEFQDADLWYKLWRLYETSNVAHERETLLYSLGCMKNVTVLKRLFYDMALRQTSIRPEDVPVVFDSLFSTTNGVTAGLIYVNETIADMEKDPLTKILVSNILSAMAGNVETDEQIEMLNKLIDRVKALEQTTFGSMTDLLRNVKHTAITDQEYSRKMIPAILEGLEIITKGYKKTSPISVMGITMIIMFILGFLFLVYCGISVSKIIFTYYHELQHVFQ